MGTKYSQQSASGYNASPPADDGSQVDSNKTKWQDHVIDKVGDPIKTLAEDIDSTLRTHFDEGPDAKSTSYTTTAADYAKTIEASSGAAITLGDPSTMGAGYRVRVKNVGSSDVTIDVASSGTIDGASSVTLRPDGAGEYIVNNGAGEYMETSVQRDPNSVLTSGLIMAWPTGTAPTGWLECDGSAVSRTTYALLFAVIGETYGNGDGSTTFNLPDLRGEFIRGYDNGAGTDPDAASRTDRGDGTTGDNVGTKQADENKSHDHGGATGGNTAAGVQHKVAGEGGGDINDSLQNFASGPGTDGAWTGTAIRDASNHTHTISSAGGNESRPTNVGMMWVIKT